MILGGKIKSIKLLRNSVRRILIANRSVFHRFGFRASNLIPSLVIRMTFNRVKGRRIIDSAAFNPRERASASHTSSNTRTRSNFNLLITDNRPVGSRTMRVKRLSTGRRASIFSDLLRVEVACRDPVRRLATISSLLRSKNGQSSSILNRFNKRYSR